MTCLSQTLFHISVFGLSKCAIGESDFRQNAYLVIRWGDIFRIMALPTEKKKIISRKVPHLGMNVVFCLMVLHENSPALINEGFLCFVIEPSWQVDHYFVYVPIKLDIFQPFSRPTADEKTIKWPISTTYWLEPNLVTLVIEGIKLVIQNYLIDKWDNQVGT